MSSQDDTTVVRMYSTRQDAEFGKMLLEGSGIPSFIRADDSGGARPYMAPVTGVRLVVRAEDLRDAENVLNQSEQEDAEQCPGPDC